MAYFTSSNLVNGQAIFTEKFLSGEWRMPDVAAFSVAQKSGVANPLLAELRTREDRSVYAYFPIRQAAIEGTARDEAHTGARGDSSSELISWSTYSEPFSISMKQADNNVFDWDMMYAMTLRNAILNLMARVDAGFVTSLVAAKTGYNAGGGNGSFDSNLDVYQVPSNYENYLFQEIISNLNYNDYRGELTVVTDNLAGILAEKLAANGSANATNYGFQFMGANFVKTNRSLLGTSAYKGSAVAFESGLVAAVPWIPKQNRKPLDPIAAIDYVGDYGQIEIPELGIAIAIHMYSDRADTSLTGGSTQDVVLYGEVSVDIGYVDAPMGSFRNAAETPVYAFGLTKE